MPENKSNSPKGPYYGGHTHFSYNNELAYHSRPAMRSDTVQSMVKRAEKTLSETPFKG
jgi:hypothetical protein